MQEYTGPNTADVPAPASHEEFLKALVPSLLSIDTDGRVLRMDSFSKVIAPGTRTGWITASEQIVEKIQQHNEASVQNPSGISQLVLYKLLDENWGHGGYLDWLMHLRLGYTGRRDTIVYAAENYLPRTIVSWVPPAAGMFVSIPLSPNFRLYYCGIGSKLIRCPIAVVDEDRLDPASRSQGKGRRCD